MAGHFIRYPEMSSHPFILWEPSQGNANRGRRRIHMWIGLRKDTGLLEKQDRRTIMLDIDVWRDLSHTDARVEDQQDHSRK